MMKKSVYLLIFISFLVLLSACGDSASDYPVPEELVISDELGQEEFEDQFGLAMGETGYVVDVPNQAALAVTLNEVTLLNEFEGEAPSNGPYFMLANFTISNFGENFIADHQMEYPVLADPADADTIASGSKPGRRDLAGYGASMYRFDTKIDADALHPEEELTGDILISVEEDLDNYLVWFGFEGYSNSITFEIAQSEAKRE